MAGRKILPHEPPRWLDASREIFFVIVNCRKRGIPQLTHPQTASKLLASVQYRHERGVWWAHIFLLMPDHCHALLSFPPQSKSLPDVVADWKRWTARKCGIEWQRDFFDHRLRDEESAWEKAEYIMDNPVRAGLVEHREQWPHFWAAAPDILRIAR